MGGLDVAWRVRQELHQFEEPGARKPLVADALVRDGPARAEDRQGLVSLRRATASRFPIRRSSRSSSATPRAPGIAAGADQRRGDPRAHDLRADQRRRARARGRASRSRAADIDVIYLTGYGFPALSRRPDVLRGSRRPRADLSIASTAFHRELGQRWAPAPLLERLAREGSTFREFDAARETATPRRGMTPRPGRVERRGAATSPVRRHAATSP